MSRFNLAITALGLGCLLAGTGAAARAQVAVSVDSGQATDDRKADSAFSVFQNRMHIAAMRAWFDKTGEYSFDLRTWSDAYFTLLGQYPRASSDYVRSNADILLGFARKDSARGPAVIAAFRASPNVMIRDLMHADEVVAEARRTPMRMQFTALDGRPVDLAKLRGKVVLIDFSAFTWCGACRENDPHVAAAYKAYHEKGLEIIGFALENSPDDRAFVEHYVSLHDMPWPEYFDGKGFENEYVQRLGIVGVPHMFLLDRSGLLVGTATGNTSMTKLEPLVRQQLGLASR